MGAGKTYHLTYKLTVIKEGGSEKICDMDIDTSDLATTMPTPGS